MVFFKKNYVTSLPGVTFFDLSVSGTMLAKFNIISNNFVSSHYHIHSLMF